MLPQFRTAENEGRSTALKPAPDPSGSSASSSLGGRPATSAFRATHGGTTSVIGPDLIIQGNLISRGEVQVEGEVQGDIHGTNIVIGEQAKITGSIIAEECIIRGSVQGTVRGRRVMLQSTSHVEGDVYHQTVAIENGAFFEGKSRRAADPLEGVHRAEMPSPPGPPQSTTSTSSPVTTHSSTTVPPLTSP